MKRNTRPFIVEVKQKRSSFNRGRSIWGDVNLSAVFAETVATADILEPSNRGLVDFGVAHGDVRDRHVYLAEHRMPDPNEAESLPATTEAAVPEDGPKVKKRVARPKKSKAQPKRSTEEVTAEPAASPSGTSSTDRATRKIYSEKERAQKLDQIEKSIGRGGTIKSSVKQAGISEQTYYQWKKVAAPKLASGDLKDLVALEEENTRLKGILAERLRKENAELKRKLGLD
jgi:hypothetical protein